MKILVLTALTLIGTTAVQAQTLDRWDATGNVIRAVNRPGGRLCDTTSAVSITIPTGAGFVRFDPPIATNFAICLENTADAACGTAVSTTTNLSTHIWEDNPITRRLIATRNNASISYKPNRMWVQNYTGTGCSKWHWNSGE